MIARTPEKGGIISAPVLRSDQRKHHATIFIAWGRSMHERILVTLLRVFGACALLALIPVILPAQYLAQIHLSLGLGEMPLTPVMLYLCRSLSAMYALQGALSLVMSLDVHRFLPLIHVNGWLVAVFGAILFAVDFHEGMPAIWTLTEGPLYVIMGMLLVYLARAVSRRMIRAKTPAEITP